MLSSVTAAPAAVLQVSAATDFNTKSGRPGTKLTPLRLEPAGCVAADKEDAMKKRF